MPAAHILPSRVELERVFSFILCQNFALKGTYPVYYQQNGTYFFAHLDIPVHGGWEKNIMRNLTRIFVFRKNSTSPNLISMGYPQWYFGESKNNTSGRLSKHVSTCNFLFVGSTPRSKWSMLQDKLGWNLHWGDAVCMPRVYRHP